MIRSIRSHRLVLFALACTQILYQISILRYLDIALINFQTVFYSSAVIFAFTLGGYYSDFVTKKIRSWKINLLLLLIAVFSHAGLMLSNSLALVLFFLGLSLFGCSLFGVKIIQIFKRDKEYFFEILTIDLMGCLLAFLIHTTTVEIVGPMTLTVFVFGIVFFLEIQKKVKHMAFASLGWFLILAFSYKLDWYTINTHKDKWIKSAQKLQTYKESYWDKVSKIDVYKRQSEQGREIYEYYYDGSSMSTWLYTWNLTRDEFYESLLKNNEELVRTRGIVIPYLIQDFQGKSICIVGSGAGQEIKVARLHSPAHIHAVESSELLIKALIKNESFNGKNFFHGNDITLYNKNARFVFSENSDLRCDLIQAISTYSTAGVASRRGAIEPSFSLTAEALKTYLGALSEMGIFQAEFIFYPELLATLQKATGLPEEELARHVLIFEHRSTAYKNLLVFRKTAFYKDELTAIEGTLDQFGLRDYKYVSSEAIFSQLALASQQSSIKIGTITDDKPYPLTGFVGLKIKDNDFSMWERFVPVGYVKNMTLYFYSSVILFIIFLFFLLSTALWKKNWWSGAKANDLAIIFLTASSQVLLCQWYTISAQATSPQPLKIYYSVSILTLAISAAISIYFAGFFEMKKRTCFLYLLAPTTALFYVFLNTPTNYSRLGLFAILYASSGLLTAFVLSRMNTKVEGASQISLYLFGYLTAFLIFPIGFLISPFVGVSYLLIAAIGFLLVGTLTYFLLRS
jgi:hypothetical protein